MVTTREELIEKAAKPLVADVGIPWEHARQNPFRPAARTVIRIALEAAAEACEQQARDFSSEEYSANQPISTITERFACAQCAADIRSLIDGIEQIGRAGRAADRRRVEAPRIPRL